MFMMDSSVCIAILRNRPRLEKLPPLCECQISQIVAAELWTGAQKSNRPEVKLLQLADFLAGFPLLNFDDSAARHYGEIRAFLEKKGKTIGPLDLLIAAHARSAGLTLLTGNVNEFLRVPDLKILAWK